MSGWIIKRGTREVPIPDEATLKTWAHEGRFNPGDLIFHPVLQRWLYAQDVIEIRDTFQKPATAAAEPVAAAPIPAASSAVPSSPRTPASDFIIRQGNQEFRAPDLATLRTWAEEQRIPPDSYIFHPVLQRWLYAREMVELTLLHRPTGADISKLASSYRQLVLWVGMQLLLSVGLLLNVVPLLLFPALIVTVVAIAVYAARTAAALGSSAASLWAVAMLIPLINVITLLVLSSKATQTCRANGIAVGLLGPRIP